MKNPEFRRLRTMAGRVASTLIASGSLVAWSTLGPAQDRAPKTGWGDVETVEPAKSTVATDLQSLFDRSQRAASVMEFNSIIEGSRTIARDSTRNSAERDYAKKLLSWAANRRGELRTDMAADRVRDGQMEDAKTLDQSAADDFALAIQYDATRWRAHHNLGVVLALTGNEDAAIDSFARTIELQPQFADAYFNRGELRVKRKDFEGAIADYSKAIELSPEDPNMHTARGRVRVASAQWNEALADFEEAMRLQPESGQAAGEYADTCQSLARWKDAALAYQKALQLAPDDPSILQNAAWMMATCPDEYYRNPETALKTAMRAVEASGGSANVHRLHVLGVAQAAVGDFASAIATLNEALQMTSDPVLRKELTQQRALFQRKKPYVQP